MFHTIFGGVLPMYRLILCLIALCMPILPSHTALAESNRTLIIVLDGVRSDYLSPENTPHLHALASKGVMAEVHSVAYPTYTRPNSSTVSTGSYPKTHGIMNNTMWHPAMGDDSFNVGSAAALRRFDAATDGGLFTTRTLGEVLDDHGVPFFVTGTAGSGTTFLQNPRGAGKGIWHPTVFVPESAREAMIEALGEVPEERGTDEATSWAFDSYLHHALGDDPPAVSLVWINQPDSTGHREGVGAPATLAAVAHADANIGRIVAAHEEHGLADKVNIFVTTDHGFSTTTGGFNVGRIIRVAGIEGDDIRVVRNMVWVDDDETLVRIGEALQRDEHTGAIYSRPARPGASEGIVPGTLSTAVIQWNHPERAADLIASPAWTHDTNEFGFPGTTAFGGRATHGSDSPYDLRVWMVAAGPGIKSGQESGTPTGNVDIAPTVLHLHGIEPPAHMDGRVWHELLVDGPAPADVEVHEEVHRAAVTLDDGFVYETQMLTLRVGDTVYMRGAETVRVPASGPGQD